jgi:hypothetical protein
LVQGDSLLSQLRLREAQAKAKKALASTEGGITARLIAAQAVRGLALLRLGDIAAGRELCAKALRTAEAGGSPAAISFAKVAMAEAAFLAHDPEARKLAKEGRDHCLRYNHRELALRALLLQWNIEQRSGAAGPAREFGAAFDSESASLDKLWGAGSLAAYLQRPDIRSLIPPK